LTDLPSLRRVQRAETVGALLASVASFGIWTLAGLMALGTLGLDLGPLIAGIVGVAVGFGSQNLVRDFISGIFMLMEDQYGVGDVVDVEVAYSTDLDDATRAIERVAHELYVDEHWAPSCWSSRRSGGSRSSAPTASGSAWWPRRAPSSSGEGGPRAPGPPQGRLRPGRHRGLGPEGPHRRRRPGAAGGLTRFRR